MDRDLVKDLADAIVGYNKEPDRDSVLKLEVHLHGSVPFEITTPIRGGKKVIQVTHMDGLCVEFDIDKCDEVVWMVFPGVNRTPEHHERLYLTTIGGQRLSCCLPSSEYRGLDYCIRKILDVMLAARPPTPRQITSATTKKRRTDGGGGGGD